MNTGKLIIISAPSGSGKSTIIGEVIKDEALKLSFSVSATTREMRRGEEEGVNYYFMTVDDFKQAIVNEEFAEFQEVYPGRYYGTLKREIKRITDAGDNVILDLDVVGGVNVKQMYGDRALSIFIKAPSIDTLRHRLLSRGTDSIEEIERRIAKAEYETGFADKFDHIVVNDVLRTAVAEVHDLIADFVADDDSDAAEATSDPAPEK